MRVKTIPAAEFVTVFERQWRPVVLAGDAQPSFLRAIPEPIRCGIIASGQHVYEASDFIGGSPIVGGIDVYRYSPDDPVRLNKDWYAVRPSSDPNFLIVDGPHKDCEHWVNEIPDRYAGAEIIGTKKRD
jgi:hypothetical protein